MAITKKLVQAAGLAAGAIGMVVATKPDSDLGRRARRLADRLGRDVRYAAASAPGLVYRLAGRRPDPNVSDDILADRIRSSLGPLEKRLDVPHVHVMVEDHVAVVHGEVPDERVAGAIECEVMRVSGVAGLESHLHAGLIPSDTRPSEGAGEMLPPSDAMRTLLSAARDAGASADAARGGARGLVRVLGSDTRPRTCPCARAPARRRPLAGRARAAARRAFAAAQDVAAVGRRGDGRRAHRPSARGGDHARRDRKPARDGP